jgi:hypothetical protein
MKQVRTEIAKNIRGEDFQFFRRGDLAPGVCAPLHLRHVRPGSLVQKYQHVEGICFLPSQDRIVSRKKADFLYRGGRTRMVHYIEREGPGSRL